jgi:hypothetical protein
MISVRVACCIVAGVLAASAPAVADDSQESHLSARETSTAFGADGVYYEDSDKNRRHDESLWAIVALDDFSLSAVGISHSAHDSTGDPDSQEALVGIQTELPWSIDFEARAGIAQFHDRTSASGSIKGKRKATWGEAELKAEYSPLYETAAIIRSRVMFAGLELAGKAALHPRVRPGLRVVLRDYSDHNQSLRVRGDLPLAIVLAPLRWELGYRQEYATYRRQSGSGYFDPSELNAYQAVTSLGYWSERIESYGEIYGGLQTSRRYGNGNSDAFYGFYMEVAVNGVGPFKVALTAEGGDYSLDSSGGFRHVQAGLRITTNP